MKIRFWGVRGSIPVPGPKTVKYGGNTSCVEVIAESGASLVLDAGTGIREFGLDYLKRDSVSNVIHLFLSHLHWDHIQGFPYFVPAMLADMEIHIYSGSDIQGWLARQMAPPFFPLQMSDLNSSVHFHVIESSNIEVAGCLVTPFSLIHPQEVFGFQIFENEKAVVYSSDTEHEVGGKYEAYIDLIHGADVLLYDAQYTPEEYQNGRIGWGHSTYEAAIDIAKKAGVKKLVLFHHEPTHDDAVIDMIEKKAQMLFPNTIAAREGMILEV